MGHRLYGKSHVPCLLAARVIQLAVAAEERHGVNAIRILPTSIVGALVCGWKAKSLLEITHDSRKGLIQNEGFRMLKYQKILTDFKLRKFSSGRQARGFSYRI